jgi:hypothetical protein
VRTIVVSTIAFVLSATAAFAADLTGRQIIDEVSKRHDKPVEYEKQVMTLVSSDQSKEVRKVERFKMDTDDGSRALMVFQDPAGVKGTALLTWQYDAKDDDQWLFLPAMSNELKRIAKGGKRNYFMGTDYTYEDLSTEKKDNFSYERKADETLDGQDSFVVDVSALEAEAKKETGYKYRRMWIRKDLYFVTRIDYFDRRENLIKRQTYDKLVDLGGGTYRAGLSLVKNLENQHVTAVQVVERSFDKDKVPDEVFLQRYVTSGKHIR